MSDDKDNECQLESLMKNFAYQSIFIVNEINNGNVEYGLNLLLTLHEQIKATIPLAQRIDNLIQDVQNES